MTPAPYFVILAAMRTGSNLLEQTLAGLADTACHGELFNPGFVGSLRYSELMGWDIERRNADPLDFLTFVRQQMPSSLTGFRLFHNHSDIVLAHVLSDPECRRIVLRRDPLESFVSLQIARATGQWILRNPARRKQTQIVFDPDAYDSYRTGLEAHYTALSARMMAAGTSALHVHYEDLAKPMVLEGLAGHIGSTGRFQSSPKVFRQNPEPLSQKVLNYAEMCAYLGREPDCHPAPVASAAADLIVPKDLPLACAAIDGPGRDAAIGLLHRLEQQLCGVSPLPWGRMLARAFEGELFEKRPLVGCPREAAQGRAVFSIVCHPLTRLHRLFETHLFGMARHRSNLRHRLAALIGTLPEPRDLATPDAFSRRQHVAAFRLFLDFILDNQERTHNHGGALKVVPQSEILDRYRDRIAAPHVGRLEDLSALGAWINSVGISVAPEMMKIEDIANRAMKGRLDVAEILVPDVIERVRRAFSEDYASFGYADLPEDAA